MAAAYSATGAAWQAGPGRVYDRLAEVLVDCSPIPLTGSRVLDVGAGTGAASRAILRAGGRPIAVDFAPGMLSVDRRHRPPAVVADARGLPIAAGSCRAVVAAFSFNHVPDPHRAFAESARVLEAGGVVVASAYAADDGHPVKAAVEAALGEAGWTPATWVSDLRTSLTPLLATEAGATSALARAGLHGQASVVAVELPDLSPHDLVAWRLGMAAAAPFVATLSADRRREVEARALDLLGDPGVLVRRMIVVRAHR